jgi:hypothetical protein
MESAHGCVLPGRHEDQTGARHDVRCFGPGERVAFLPSTADMYERAQRWMRDRGLFEEREAVTPYESVVQV